MSGEPDDRALPKCDAARFDRVAYRVLIAKDTRQRTRATSAVSSRSYRRALRQTMLGGVIELDRELVRIARTCDVETEPGGGFGRVTYRFHVMKDTRELGTLFED